MRGRFTVFAVLVGLVLVAAPLLAQNPTGTITGTVTYEGDALPGVTVTASSPAMQGTKTAITGGNGAYTFKFLPPGDYKLTFALDSFRTLEQAVKVSVAQTKTIDAVMYPEAVTEEIVVTSNYETISSSSQAATTYEQSLVEDLPVARDLNNAVLLSPGTTSNGPRGGITIAGSQSYENLFLVNGVVVNENLRGQAFDLFIEDAIEETTTQVSGISAEYGRFAGGVVNMITKSGGNEFSGSFRVNLTNDDWVSTTRFNEDHLDDINEVYEATLGGYIMKDRLWFFLAGRDFETTGSHSYYGTGTGSFATGRTQERYEAKLTLSPHVSHRFIGSYMEIDTTDTNYFFYEPLTYDVIDPSRSLPQEFWTINYTGVLSENFFLEGQYAKRKFTFSDSGGDAEPGDRINGTHILFYPTYSEAGSSLFCAKCGDENRDMENYLAKGSYFLSTESMGTHDISFGYDSYTDIRLSNNYQSPSNFNIWNYSLDGADEAAQWNVNGTLYPMFEGGEDIDYWPIFVLSRGTDFVTDSMYVNDTWRYNNHLTITAGVRWDKNDGVDGAGNQVADDSRYSPRLGATYDINADGEWIINASFGRYVTAIANSVADSGGGGTPSYFGYTYGGPMINVGPDGEWVPEYTTTEALAILFDWFDSVGGLANTDLWYANPSIRGVNTIVENLKSPYADEYSVGLTKRFGNKGLVRADYVHREFHDFYATKRDTTTGYVTADVQLTEGVNIQQDFDLGIVVNEDSLLRREYDGLHTQFSYRLNDRLSLGGNWTWSHARGNFEGETSGSGPVSSGILAYPEFLEPSWYAPMGDLSIDQRHKVRAWLVWEALSTAHHNLTVSWLENYWTGTPYGGLLSRVVVLPSYTGIENPGYLSPPVSNSYWVTPRDAFRTDDIHRSDLSLNYSFFMNLFGADVELFLQPEILNVFDEDGTIAVNTTVNPTGYVTSFNPFTEEPVEGVDYEFSDAFGQAETEDDLQTPRTFRFSVGFRF